MGCLANALMSLEVSGAPRWWVTRGVTKGRFTALEGRHLGAHRRPHRHAHIGSMTSVSTPDWRSRSSAITAQHAGDPPQNLDGGRGGPVKPLQTRLLPGYSLRLGLAFRLSKTLLFTCLSTFLYLLIDVSVLLAHTIRHWLLGGAVRKAAERQRHNHGVTSSAPLAHPTYLCLAWRWRPVSTAVETVASLYL